MSTPAVAYELTPEHDLAAYGGTVHLRDGISLNIGEALQEGDGFIVTDDPLLIRTLDVREDLQRGQPPANALITSHQLAPTALLQHEWTGEPRPEIASVSYEMSAGEIMAAQARGDMPVPTGAPAPPASTGSSAPAAQNLATPAGTPPVPSTPSTGSSTAAAAQPTPPTPPAGGGQTDPGSKN